MASRHTSALADPHRNRNQLAHPHQVLRRHHQPIEPVHPPQSPQLDLFERTVQFRPPEHPLDQLALLLTNRPPWVGALRLVQRVLAQARFALAILAHVRGHAAFPQRRDKLLVLILRVGPQRDLRLAPTTPAPRARTGDAGRRPDSHTLRLPWAWGRGAASPLPPSRHARVGATRGVALIPTLSNFPWAWGARRRLAPTTLAPRARRGDAGRRPDSHIVHYPIGVGARCRLAPTIYARGRRPTKRYLQFHLRRRWCVPGFPGRTASAEGYSRCTRECAATPSRCE